MQAGPEEVVGLVKVESSEGITTITMAIITITITMATIMRMRRGAIGAERRSGARSPHGP